MYTLKELAGFIDAKIIGDANLEITAIASISLAKKNQLSYIVSKKNTQDLTTSQAGAILLNENLLSKCPTNALVVDNVRLAFAKLTHYFKQQPTHSSGIHSSVKITHAKIAQNCVIGEHVVIGNHCVIGAHCVIEAGVMIGDNTHIGSNVVILQNCLIGNNVVIAPGVVIGSEGFGNVKDNQGHWHTIAHLGRVVIGNHVTIGANTTIDRGTLEDTQIHDGVRLDNLIHIAHNVIIGQDTAIAANTGIAGSTILGKRCMIAGMVGIIDHINICDDAIISGNSTIDKDIKKPGLYTGIMPLMPHKQWQNISIWLTKLDKITKYLNVKLKNLKD